MTSVIVGAHDRGMYVVAEAGLRGLRLVMWHRGHLHVSSRRPVRR